MADDAKRPDHQKALMLRFQGGDAAAFGELVESAKREIFALGYRYGLKREDADDLAQEVFLRVYRARARYRPEAPFRAWLLRIAQNLIVSGARKRKLRKTLSLDQLRPSDDGPNRIDVVDARVAAPWERLRREERRNALERALATLPERQRIALVLNRFHDQSYEQVAAALELKIPAVKSLLFRARQALLKALQQVGGDP